MMTGNFSIICCAHGTNLPRCCMAKLRFDSMAVLDYGRDAQNACLHQTPLPSPLDYTSDKRYPMQIKQLNTLFTKAFYHPSLRTVLPFLNQLCQKYIRTFYRLSQRNPAAADKKLAQLKQNLYQKLPNLDEFLQQYYVYYLYTNFLDIFEDYSFLETFAARNCQSAHALGLYCAVCRA